MGTNPWEILNPFNANFPFVYLPENVRNPPLFDVFRVYNNGSLSRNGLMKFYFLTAHMSTVQKHWSQDVVGNGCSDYFVKFF